jgi:hypothetical protein
MPSADARQGQPEDLCSFMRISAIAPSVTARDHQRKADPSCARAPPGDLSAMITVHGIGAPLHHSAATHPGVGSWTAAALDEQQQSAAAAARFPLVAPRPAATRRSAVVHTHGRTASMLRKRYDAAGQPLRKSTFSLPVAKAESSSSVPPPPYHPCMAVETNSCVRIETESEEVSPPMSIVTSPVSSATVSQRAEEEEEEEEEEDELLPHSMAFPARGPVLGGVAHTQTNDDDANENGTRAGAPNDISTAAAAVQPSATTEGASSDYESDSCEDEQDTAAAADEIGGRSDGYDDGGQNGGGACSGSTVKGAASKVASAAARRSRKKKKRRRQQGRRKNKLSSASSSAPSAQKQAQRRLREFSSRVAHAVLQSVADTRAGKPRWPRSPHGGEGDAAAVEEAKPWRHCMAPQSKTAADPRDATVHGRHGMAAASAPEQQHQEEEGDPEERAAAAAALVAAAAAAAQARVNLASRKLLLVHGAGHAGHAGHAPQRSRYASMGPPPHRYGPAGLIPGTAAAARSDASFVPEAEGGGWGGAAISKSGTRSLADSRRSRGVRPGQDGAQEALSICSSGGGSPLRRRAATAASRSGGCGGGEPARPVMSPASLERFQAEQQEKALARIKERKQHVEEVERREAEAAEQERLAKRKHAEVQEVKAQRRAEIYALNVAKRRAEQLKYKQYQAQWRSGADAGADADAAIAAAEEEASNDYSEVNPV